MKFTKKVLKNGMTLLHEEREFPVTTVMLASKYGYAYELEEEKGIAHFLEHLCFKGTKKRTAEQISSEIESVGGVINAFTHEEVTAYHATLPSEHFAVAMEVIFDTYFNPTFPEEEIKKEALVICEEIKMYRDSPNRHVFDKIKEMMYEKPFGISGAGREEVVKAIKREQILEKHKKYYHPKNTILIVVGNNSLKEVETLIEKFQVNSSGEIPKLPEIIKKVSSENEKRKDIEQANVTLGIHMPIQEKNLRYAVEVFSTILGSGMSSKLFTEVREKKGLVYSVRSDLDIGKNYGYMVIYAGTAPERVSEVIKVCKEEFKKMKDLTEEELKRGKAKLIGNRRVELEGSSETSVNLLMEEVFSDARNFYEKDKRINEVNLNDIKEIANLSEFSSFVLGP